MQKSLGEIIRKLRTDAGWSQVQLATRAKVSQQLIGKLEKGTALESRKIVNIAAAFGMTVEQLLNSHDGVKQESPRWPFDIEFARFAALPERDRVKIEGIIENVIREHERELANSLLRSKRKRRDSL